MSSATLEQWLQRLQKLHPKEIELGLERVASVARVLQLLPVSPPVITVAGTNGKGTTVAVLEALLIEAGYSTGTFTSPHLLRFNERIRVGAQDVDDAQIIAAFQAIDEARGSVSLTYFEFSALAALLVFKSQAVDVIVLEVGLGGRFDAVNIVDPSLAVITSIDLDHQDWLGDSRDAIAREKAGILRPSTPVVIADPDPPASLPLCVAEVGAAPALFLGRDFTLSESHGQWRAQVRDIDGASRVLPAQPRGSLLPQNICAAIQALLLLDIALDDAVITRALARAAPPGRRQLRWAHGLEYVLDVAHNPAAVNKLVEFLREAPCNGKSFALFSIMADKDMSGMLKPATGIFDAWFLADQPNNPRAATAVAIARMLREAQESQVSVSKNLRQALRRARSLMVEGDRLVVFGSFYTVAGVLPLLDRQSIEHGEG